MEKPTIARRQVVYKNPYQQVYKVEVSHQDFTKEFFVTDYGKRVGIVVAGPDGILLTRQYRHLIERLSWEIPGGKVEDGEDLEEAARRECLEETRLHCGNLKTLIAFHPGMDTLHNPTLVYHTDQFKKDADQRLAADEVAVCQWVPLENCIKMIQDAQIVDSLSIIALLSYKTFIGSL